MAGRGLTDKQLALLVLYGGAGVTERGDWIVAGASPYEVEKLIRDGVGGVLGYVKSSCYAQTKRLAEAGYLSAIEIEGTPRSTTVYSLTASGVGAVEAWMRKPAEPPLVDSEAFIRVRAARFVAPDVILGGLSGLRPKLTRRLAEVDAAEHQHNLGPEMPAYSDALEIDLIRSVLQAHLRWLDLTEKALRREVRTQERREKNRLR